MMSIPVHEIGNITNVAQDLSTKKFAIVKVLNGCLVLRNPFVFAIYQSKSVKQVGRDNRRVADAGLHGVFLRLKIEWFVLFLAAFLILLFFGLFVHAGR
jgi:hypothetical protein